MVRSLRIKFNSVTVFEYLFVFLLIFECRSIFMHTANKPSWLQYGIILLLCISMAGCMIKFCYTDQLLSNILAEIIILWAYLGIFIFAMPYHILGIVRIGVVVSLFLIFYSFHCKNNGFSIMLKYRNIIFILAVISLFFWFFGFLLGWLQPNTSVISNWTGQEKIQNMFFYLSGSTQSISMFSLQGIPRNTSIFTEAPMASLHFSLAYIFEEFKNPKSSKCVKLILILAILSTFSTTGYILLVGVFMAKLFRMKAKNGIQKSLKYIASIFLAVLGCYILYYLLTGKLGTGSGSSRLSDFTNGLKTWSQSVFWGYGFRYEDVTGTGYSNSVTPILLSGGIYAAASYAFIFTKGIYNSIRKKDWDGLIFIGLYLFMFVVTIVSFQYLTFFVMMYISNEPRNSIKYAKHEKIAGS